MNPISFEEFSASIDRLKQRDEPFALATIIRVFGSASAKVGSKAIFDESGKNIFGWIGGGCAERFIGEQAVESLKEKQGRVVLADLDDEVFGLGVACGGKMEVFIDPILPLEELSLREANPKMKELAEDLASAYGIKLKWGTSEKKILSSDELLIEMADALALHRESTGESLKKIKNLPTSFGPMDFSNFRTSVSIIGSGRIIESLAKHFSILEWNVRVISGSEFESVDIAPGECILIASHSARDREFVRFALEQQPAYVGMVGSRKRALEIIEHLNLETRQLERLPLFIPAGIDLHARNPNEIGLSIAVEI